MSVLKGLKFSAIPAKVSDPVANRRGVKKLQEQKALADDPNYIRKSTHFTGKGPDRHTVTKEQRVRSWARPSPDGGLVFSVYLGARPIEFQKGMTGVQVASADELPDVIDKLIAALNGKELDEAISRVMSAKQAKKAVKKAA